MEYLLRMNNEEVLKAFIELEIQSYMASFLLQKKEIEKGPKILNFTDGSHGFERPDVL